MSATLIKSKLRPPVIGRDTVSRAHLLNRLDYHRPLTLISAPAGYGKTTLMVDWLAHSGYPCTWLALDAYDDSLTGFLSYVLAALEVFFPNLFPETRAMLNSGALLDPKTVAQLLVNELEDAPHGVVLVLDDYHSIQDAAVHQLMVELLRYQPHGLELVLLTRYDPPLQLAELRMRNRITELRAHDLRFTPEEARTFLQASIPTPVEDRQVAALAAMTEGWPAGIRMTALLLQRYGDVNTVVTNLEASEHFAAKYLMDEVFNYLAPDLQSFLLRTAHMEQVSGALCAAVIGGDLSVEQCQSHLMLLAQHNLFVFAVDAKGGWYRYHHLFRAVLVQRAEQSLTSAQMAALHERASLWLVANGQIAAAIAHAVKTGDVQAVASLVRDHRHDHLNVDDWAALETWRALIPQAMLEQHPQLLMLDAWLLSRRALLPEVSRRLDAIESLLAASPMPDDELRLLRSEVDALCTQPFYWAAEIERCIAAGQRALRETPLDYAYARSVTRVFLTGALETVSSTEADALMAEGLREARLQRTGPAESRELITTGLLCWTRAEMDRMVECTNQILAKAQERGALEFVAWARFLRACACYQQNDLAGVEGDFAAVLEAAFIARPFVYSQSFLGLAATFQAQGKTDQARRYVEQGVAFAKEYGNPLMVSRAEGFLAHLSFRQGRLDEAFAWVAQPCRIPPDMPMPLFHATLVGRAAILLGLGGAEARDEADELLLRLHAETVRYRNRRFLIEVLALQAYSLACSGKKTDALDLLEQSVLLTVPGETIRALADLDHLIGPLLAELSARSSVRGQVARIRRAAVVRVSPAFADGQAPAKGAHPPSQPGAPSLSVRHPDLLEPLTFRELDVLLLLQERPSNKEIAQQLCIAPETVKRHLTNIYLKLHVQSRREALFKAREMGLLPSK